MRCSIPILAAVALVAASHLAGPATLAGPTRLDAQTQADQRLADHPRVAEALRVVEIWIEAQRAYEQIPGISAAIVHDQETVWLGADGMAHPERGAPATPETLYSICSISKLFTGIAVMQLRDQGLLALSDPVDRHLRWFELAQAHPGGRTAWRSSACPPTTPSAPSPASSM